MRGKCEVLVVGSWFFSTFSPPLHRPLTAPLPPLHCPRANPLANLYILYTPMAKIKHNNDVEEVIGAHAKGGMVERRKHFYDYDGNITQVGRLEVYKPRPRNYKANPIFLRERANMTAFGNASHLAQEFINALKTKTPLEPEKQAFLDSIMARFYKQLKGTPDPIAPRAKDGTFTIYARPDNFIRAVLRKEPPSFNE